MRRAPYMLDILIRMDKYWSRASRNEDTVSRLKSSLGLFLEFLDPSIFSKSYLLVTLSHLIRVMKIHDQPKDKDIYDKDNTIWKTSSKSDPLLICFSFSQE